MTWQIAVLGAVVLLIVALIVAVLYPVFYPEPQADRIHKAQQDALKRHAKTMQKDRERIARYWRDRSKVIKPLDTTRYGAWVDETKEVL